MRKLSWWLLVGCAALPARATAYSIQTSRSGAPLHWAAPAGEPAQVTVRRDTTSPSRWLDEGQVTAALDGALTTWSAAPTMSSAPVVLAEGPSGAMPSSAPLEVWLRFVHEGWPHAAQQLASTQLYARDHSGEITGAIIEVNEDQHAFEALAGADDHSDAAGRYDLQAVLTHEIGHLLGLGHSMDAHATMFPSTAPDDAEQRRLGDDDMAGLMSLYTSAAPSATTSSSTGKTNTGGTMAAAVGCQTAPGRPAHAPLALLGALAAFVLGRLRHARARQRA